MGQLVHTFPQFPSPSWRVDGEDEDSEEELSCHYRLSDTPRGHLLVLTNVEHRSVFDRRVHEIEWEGIQDRRLRIEELASRDWILSLPLFQLSSRQGRKS